MPTDVAALLADLRAECEEVDGLVAGLPDTDWARMTPAPGWTIAHQIAHLAWTDEQALLAANDEAAFAAAVRKAAEAPERFVDDGAAEGAKLPPAELLARWRADREQLETTLAGIPAGTKIPWYATPMSAASMATARLMEVWAHGLDIADTLGVSRTPSARLRHVAHLGVRTRDFSFHVRQLPPPTEQFRVELEAPDGSEWSWGPPDAAQRVTGPALDFCLLVTQRRHRDDTALRATGADADSWLNIAQAFAGPSGDGRAPGQFG